jgi:hypothetical protein
LTSVSEGCDICTAFVKPLFGLTVTIMKWAVFVSILADRDPTSAYTYRKTVYAEKTASACVLCIVNIHKCLDK